MLNARKSQANLLDIKMGLKRANINWSINLDENYKCEMDENNLYREHVANNNGTRTHTDFSIDKILSDVTPRAGVSNEPRQRLHHPTTDYFNWNRRIYPPIAIDVPNLFLLPRATAATTNDAEIVDLSLRIGDRRQFNSIGENLISACASHTKSIDNRHFYNSEANELFPNKYEQCSRMYSISQNFKYFGIDFRVDDEHIHHHMNNNVYVKNEPCTTETVVTNLTSNNLTCSVCNKVFENTHVLEMHERTHKSPKYKCEECGKGFSQLRNFKYHVSVHKGTKEFAAKCPECDKLFNDKGYLSSHLKIHRNKKEYVCPHCPKSFNQRVAFNMHARIHSGIKPHKCTECGKCFSRKMLLKQHLRTHSGEKPYQCSICLKTFADRSNMTLHQRLHSGIKPFVCTICPKAFTKKHHLKTHLNYHIGCKPYICPHENCGKSFTQSSNMRTHSRKCEFKPPEN